MSINFFKKKFKQDKQLASGLYLGQKPEVKQKSELAVCLARAVLVFFVVYGSLGGFLSAFQMEYSAALAAVCLLLCALYFGFLFTFKRKIWKDIGYILFFILYVIGIFYLRNYANSGFAAIINAVRSRGEVFFDLEAGMPFKELIENPFLTVTVIFVFIGMFEIIVLNIFVSGYMSLKLPILVAFTMYGIPLYFRVEPDLPYVFCMLFGLAGIYMFKNNGKRVNVWALPAVFAVVVLVGIGTLFFSNNEWNRQYVENEYKTATREGVSGFISLGFLIFFQNSYSTGGMNGGELGNISAIRPTGAVHLRVQYTPYDTSPVYLKAFTGFTYAHNTWKNRLFLSDESDEESSSPGMYEELLTSQLKLMQEGYKEDKGRYAEGLMRITNIAADEKYYYLPYLSETLQELKQGDSDARLYFPAGMSVEVWYYPMVAPAVGIETGILPTDYEVPGENWDAVSQACQEAGLVFGQEDAIEKVEAYLEQEYTYSYSPGKAPWGEDVINYFLQTNKKGICAHFASAATLMLRRLGYPARYVEGYAIGYGDVVSGKQLQEKYEDFYDGYSPLGKTAVMEVDVTDADAHAWVEVYDRKCGWRIIDPTPSSVEAPAGDFWRALQGLLPDSQDTSDDGGGVNLGFLRSNKWRAAGIILVIVFVMAYAGWLLSKYAVRYRLLHSDDRRANLLFAYRERCRKLAKKDAAFAELSTPSQRIPYLAAMSRSRHAAPELTDEELVEKMEAACFGPKQPEEEDYQMLWRFLRGKNKKK